MRIQEIWRDRSYLRFRLAAARFRGDNNKKQQDERERDSLAPHVNERCSGRRATDFYTPRRLG